MKSLIIGGAGFVGAYLVRHLKNDLGQDVVVTKMPREQVKVDGVDMNSIQVRDLDILQKESIVALFREIRPDYIYHLAAQSSVSVSWKNPALTVDVNVKGGVNILEALRELKISLAFCLLVQEKNMDIFYRVRYRLRKAMCRVRKYLCSNESLSEYAC